MRVGVEGVEADGSPEAEERAEAAETEADGGSDFGAEKVESPPPDSEDSLY